MAQRVPIEVWYTFGIDRWAAWKLSAARATRLSAQALGRLFHG